MSDSLDSSLRRLDRELKELAERFDDFNRRIGNLSDKLEEDSNEVDRLAGTGLFTVEVPDTEDVRVCYSIMTRKAARLVGTNYYIRKDKDGYQWIELSGGKALKAKGSDVFEAVPEHLKDAAIFNINLFR